MESNKQVSAIIFGLCLIPYFSYENDNAKSTIFLIKNYIKNLLIRIEQSAGKFFAFFLF